MAKRIGALWKRESEKGKTYLSGVLDMGAFGEVRVSIFKNDRKEKENQPDYRLPADSLFEVEPVADLPATDRPPWWESEERRAMGCAWQGDLFI
jgi:uncharacterized protein (DUF736 family)